MVDQKSVMLRLVLQIATEMAARVATNVSLRQKILMIYTYLLVYGVFPPWTPNV